MYQNDSSKITSILKGWKNLINQREIPKLREKIKYLVNIFRFKTILKAIFIRISNPISARVWCMHLNEKKKREKEKKKLV